MNTQSKAPRQRPGGNRGAANRPQRAQGQYNRRVAGSQPVYAANGQAVGQVRDGVLRKNVRGSAHFLRKPPAIAWDLSALEQAKALGAVVCEVTDSETGRVYTASLADLELYGFRLNRGHGNQLALPLGRWEVSRPGQPVAEQLRLPEVAP